MNDPSRILVVFYSRSETTAALAGQIVDRLGGDCERLHEVESGRRAGLAGYVRSIVDVIRGHTASLQPMTHAPRDYDLVVIGTPVWAGRTSTPVATWLAQHASELRRTAFFCTMGGSGSQKAFAQMQQVARSVPVATCALCARDVQKDVAIETVNGFVSEIRNALAPRERASAGQ
ncbi:MAG TPA: flavodoxin [Paraburkholderia sp.]|jgi:flavodoxin|nr:flavodoxin [Paraburkholderia sp.]